MSVQRTVPFSLSLSLSAMSAEALCIELRTDRPTPSLALPSNNEGIYFINTGYPPRGIVLSDQKGEREREPKETRGEVIGESG